VNIRDYKKRTRREAIARLEKVVWYLDRIWDRKCPPLRKDAPVAEPQTPEEFRRDLMAMHVDDRELLLASSDLHAIIDDLRLVLPTAKGGVL
jgi:hypothetical protein